MIRDLTRIAATMAAVIVAASPPALAAGAADVIRARHDGYRELGAAFKNVKDELRGSSPQPLILQLSARQIRNVAQQQYGWFPAGSGPAPGVKTKARPEIWTQAAAFKGAQDGYARQATAFGQAVASNDMSRIRAAAKALGASCAACHKQFRVADS